MISILSLLVLTAAPQLDANSGEQRLPALVLQKESEPRTPIDATQTPGDGDSVFRIAKAGSYYLTGNVIGQPGKSGIEIAASNVTIDLMGFSLRGKGVGTSGIRVDGVRERVAVRNGSVVGFVEDGVDLSSASATRISRTQAAANGVYGIKVGSLSTLSLCTADANGNVGLVVGVGSLIVDSLARGNGSYGIYAAGQSRIARCESRDNQGYGFYVGNSTTAIDCSAFSNSSSGFRLASGAEARRCMSKWNGVHGFDAGNSSAYIEACRADGNDEYGIRVTGSSQVLRNVVRENGSGGVGGGIRIEGNFSVVEDNSSRSNVFLGYHVSGVDNMLRGNTAAQNGFNWSVNAGNYCRVILAAASGGFFGDTGGAALGALDVNANYTY